jgi:peptidoglycan L-alanyl-D-glutamate endopeptidase CwlK
MSRSYVDLCPEMRELFITFYLAMFKAGIHFILTCTRRSKAEQEALYKQGRSKPGKIVTWTRHSKHLTGEAFDIAILKHGKITWEPEDYVKAGEIGESIGLEWGGRWEKKDLVHFQLSKKSS